MRNSAIEKKRWSIVLAVVCFAGRVLGGVFYLYGVRERVEPTPFLTQPSLEQVSFHDQWQNFWQKERDILTKSVGVRITPVPLLIEADDFFRVLDVGLRDQQIL